MMDTQTSIPSSGNKTFVLRRMIRSQIIANEAKSLARAQQEKESSGMSGERENHLHVNKCHKPNMGEKRKSFPWAVLLATKREMR